jgi:hypothetical protein
MSSLKFGYSDNNPLYFTHNKKAFQQIMLKGLLYLVGDTECRIYSFACANLFQNETIKEK